MQDLTCDRRAAQHDLPSACSASNYLLGLTPVQLAPFAAGTLSGMAAWCSVYGTLGGAGRSVLKQGTSLDALLSGMICHAFSTSLYTPVYLSVLTPNSHNPTCVHTWCHGALSAAHTPTFP